jgi:hypothetical protein
MTYSRALTTYIPLLTADTMTLALFDNCLVYPSVNVEGFWPRSRSEHLF